MLLAWGTFPPSGFYEGTFGDIGSFHGCLAVPENELVKHAHYCTLSFKPILPARASYELIVRREPSELLKLFQRDNHSEDAFDEILRNAQYSHYIYYKLGTCWPIQCTPRDVQRVARLVGKRNLLVTGPVKCLSKHSEDYQELNSTSQQLSISTRDLNEGIYIWKPHMTRAQLISLLVLGLILSLVLALTLLDLTLRQAPKLIKLISRQEESDDQQVVDWDSTGVEQEESHLNDGDDCDEDPNNNDLPMQKLHRDEQLFGEKQVKRTLHSERLNNGRQQDKLALKMRQCNSGKLVKDSTSGQQETVEEEEARKSSSSDSLLTIMLDDYSLVTNLQDFFRQPKSSNSNDILCINGIRCITMSWIIITHTMQYNDWSAFARTREIETHLKSLINQPLFNGSYLVDTFFLVSGLLTSYSSFKLPAESANTNNQTKPTIRDRLANFSWMNYLIGRYLRLTPQILFVSLLFIVLPLMSSSGSPHWYTMTGEYSENCAHNWWVNLLHLQAFYKSSEMCNFVCWWVSVDMLYHLFALMLILILLHFGRLSTLVCSSLVLLASGSYQAAKHYKLSLPPNLLSTIPQTGAMWSEMTLELFWKPYGHLSPFLLGFFLGYLLAEHSQQIAQRLNARRALVGWLSSVSVLVLVSYSTYFWVVGEADYSRAGSTLFYLLSPLLWCSCVGAIILLCQLDRGGFVNSLLSCRLFVVLGKASYMVYLSHFLVLFAFFGSQNLLLEPTQLLMTYVIVGNISLSMLFGSMLCVLFEMPWLKTQRRIMKNLRRSIK